MAQVVVTMKTIDLREAELQPVAGKEVKTLQALLNLFLNAGDIGEDGSPIPPLTLDGTAGAKTKQATLAFSDGGPSRHGRYRWPADLEEARRAGFLNLMARRATGE